MLSTRAACDMCGQCIQREKKKRSGVCFDRRTGYRPSPEVEHRAGSSSAQCLVSTPGEKSKHASGHSNWSRKLGEKWKQLKRSESFESLSSILGRKRRSITEQAPTPIVQESIISQKDEPEAERYDRLMLRSMQINQRIHELQLQSQKLDVFLEHKSVLKTQEGWALAQRTINEATVTMLKKRTSRCWIECANDMDLTVEDNDCSFQTAVDRTSDQFYDASNADETDECESFKSLKIGGLKDLMNGLILTNDKRADVTPPFESPKFLASPEFLSPESTPETQIIKSGNVWMDSPKSNQDSGIGVSPEFSLPHTPVKKRPRDEDDRKHSFVKKIKFSRENYDSSPRRLLTSEVSPSADTPPSSKLHLSTDTYRREHFGLPERSDVRSLQKTPSMSNPLMRRELKTIKIQVDALGSLGIGVEECNTDNRRYFMVSCIRAAAADSKLLRIGDELVRIGNRKLKDASVEDVSWMLSGCQGVVELQIARKPDFYFDPDDNWDEPRQKLPRSRSDSEIWGPKVDCNYNEVVDDYTNFDFDESTDVSPILSGMLKFKVRKSTSTQSSGQQHTVVLERSVKRLGFTIVGGVDSNKGKMGIFVKNVLSDGRAGGLLKPGDELLAVNGISLQGATHVVALQKIRSAKKGKMVFLVARR